MRLRKNSKAQLKFNAYSVYYDLNCGFSLLLLTHTHAIYILIYLMHSIQWVMMLGCCNVCMQYRYHVFHGICRTSRNLFFFQFRRLPWCNLVQSQFSHTRAAFLSIGFFKVKSTSEISFNPDFYCSCGRSIVNRLSMRCWIESIYIGNNTITTCCYSIMCIE